MYILLKILYDRIFFLHPLHIIEKTVYSYRVGSRYYGTLPGFMREVISNLILYQTDFIQSIFIIMQCLSLINKTFLPNFFSDFYVTFFRIILSFTIFSF